MAVTNLARSGLHLMPARGQGGIPWLSGGGGDWQAVAVPKKSILPTTLALAAIGYAAIFAPGMESPTAPILM
ncbi:MAG: hypothetical protein VX427_08345 [Acidobacteriota bacterium]|nr:hypothetical protein [Acidobacteriota bacterium]